MSDDFSQNYERVIPGTDCAPAKASHEPMVSWPCYGGPKPILRSFHRGGRYVGQRLAFGSSGYGSARCNMDENLGIIDNVLDLAILVGLVGHVLER